jgi:hypothetical protein
MGVSANYATAIAQLFVEEKFVRFQIIKKLSGAVFSKLRIMINMTSLLDSIRGRTHD